MHHKHVPSQNCINKGIIAKDFKIARCTFDIAIFVKPFYIIIWARNFLHLLDLWNQNSENIVVKFNNSSIILPIRHLIRKSREYIHGY